MHLYMRKMLLIYIITAKNITAQLEGVVMSLLVATGTA